jgi:hypothetical protein
MSVTLPISPDALAFPNTHELRNELVEELIPNLGEEMHAELVPRSREVTEIEE